MIKLYIKKENIFAIIVHKILVQKKYYNILWQTKDAMPKKGDYVKLKNYEKIKVNINDLCRLSKYISGRK